uniref:General transcription factor 3C polypeptide 6 n=1 Tax=Petromyzon marinus TaxID=7757 RepID=A0AAJ7T286_PETMA|nr:general transcription factor 3C polypeptide 6 [Petromyzon marinus]
MRCGDLRLAMASGDEWDDGDWEEEEQYVVVELSGIIDSDFLAKCNNSFKMLGVDTDEPIMQLGGCVFAGRYEDALGTCVLFKENATSGPGDASEGTALSYQCHTAKKLLMHRMFLSERQSSEPISGIEAMQLDSLDGYRHSSGYHWQPPKEEMNPDVAGGDDEDEDDDDDDGKDDNGDGDDDNDHDRQPAEAAAPSPGTANEGSKEAVPEPSLGTKAEASIVP